MVVALVDDEVDDRLPHRRTRRAGEETELTSSVGQAQEEAVPPAAIFPGHADEDLALLVKLSPVAQERGVLPRPSEAPGNGDEVSFVLGAARLVVYLFGVGCPAE